MSDNTTCFGINQQHCTFFHWLKETNIKSVYTFYGIKAKKGKVRTHSWKFKNKIIQKHFTLALAKSETIFSDLSGLNK